MNGATFLRHFLDKVVLILVIRNLTRTAMKLRMHAASILTSLAIMCAVYTLVFRVTVQRGSVIFDLYEDGVDAKGGSGTFFWFSETDVYNQIGYVAFWPILRIRYGCRSYSSFESDADRNTWFQAGGILFIDDVSKIRVP